MQLATWLTILVLGPGSLAIFAWFLRDVKHIFHRDEKPNGDIQPQRGDSQ